MLNYMNIIIYLLILINLMIIILIHHISYNVIILI